MSGSSGNDQVPNAFLLFSTLVLIGCFFYVKNEISILHWYLEWRLAVCAFASICVGIAFYFVRKIVLRKFALGHVRKAVIGEAQDSDSIQAGKSNEREEVFVKPSMRIMHTQIVGTTNAGKTESVICPWAVDDIKRGGGFLLIDGKSDKNLLNKLYAYAEKYGRLSDFRILSLADISISHTYNPFFGGSVIEVAERIFGAFEFENEYYKSVQYQTLIHALLLLEANSIQATPKKVIELLQNELLMAELLKSSGKRELVPWVSKFLKLQPQERESRVSGLVNQLQAFALGEMGRVFNSERSDIVLDEVLDKNLIVYCQLPAMKIPALGKATGKMILQSLQSAISNRHLGKAEDKKFFSVYLDDFTEYLTPSFVTLLNKSRSANVGIVFAHQALGDLDVLGDGLKNSILTNSNLKVFMRTNEPASAEYFSKVIGTVLGQKETERAKRGLFGSSKTGDVSVRETEEFKFHPNLFKQDLGVGEAVMVLPHPKGSLPVRLKFYRLRDMPEIKINEVEKFKPLSLLDSNEEGERARENRKTRKLDSRTATQNSEAKC